MSYSGIGRPYTVTVREVADLTLRNVIRSHGRVPLVLRAAERQSSFRPPTWAPSSRGVTAVLNAA
ncbi:hypothetical protein BJV78DRAFT_1242563 [Lactifluus subvellereus]|nr:hypothetical protein BJV78DRAFT_1242563 [Lactifluus subvellereus]